MPCCAEAIFIAALLAATPPPQAADEAPRQLAGSPLAGPSVPDPEAAAQQPEDWTLCRVRVELLQTGRGGTRSLVEDERLLFLGENLDLERTVSLSESGREALVALRVRLRASAVLSPGVMYLVTTEGELSAAIGYEPLPSARHQVRHELMETRDGSTQLREVYASPDLGLRVLLAVTSTPLGGRAPAGADAGLGLLPGAIAPELHAFRVVAARRFDGKLTPLRDAVLQARLGRDAAFQVELRPAGTGAAGGEEGAEPGGGEGAEGAAPDPSRRLGRSVRVSDRGYHPDSGFGEDHVVDRRAADDRFLSKHQRRADTSYLAEHRVEPLREDAPSSFTIRKAKKRGLSAKKREALRQAQEIQFVRDQAALRSKTLVGSGGATGPPEPTHLLSFVLTPLHATDGFVQVEIALSGRIVLDGEVEPTRIDTRFVESLRWGEVLELGLAELMRGGSPSSDYVISVTPLP